MSARPWIIAHRGASIERPENTLAAYQRAIELGADYIELDVHVTQDGVVVCHHDEAVHVNGEWLPIAEHPFDALRKVFPDLPTLQQVAKLPFGTTGLMVELKEGKRLFVSEVFDQLRECVCPSLILGSFSRDVMRELALRWPTGQLIGIAEETYELMAHIRSAPRYLAISIALATPQRVQQLRAQGFEVWVWTVDDPHLARALWESGVQGIITNDPRVLLSYNRSE